MKVLQRLCRIGFSQSKKPLRGLKGYFRARQTEANEVEEVELSAEEREVYENSHRLVYVPYMPTVLLVLPALFLFSNPTDVTFLKSCNLLQYYSSGVLCFNAYFSSENMVRYLYFMAGVAAINCFSGPISIVSPMVLAAMNFYFPFTDEKLHKLESEGQNEKFKSMMGSQGLFYFVIAVVTTLKVYHYLMIKEMEGKLRKYQIQNKHHFLRQESAQ